MLRQLDLSNLGQSVVTILTSVVIVLIALTCHEAAHGFAAMKLGDQTAKRSGRLSLNPLAHLDPIGFLCMLLFGFGWARPVPVDARNFKKPKRDMALTALAGPIANLLLAFVILIPYALLVKLLGGGAIAVRTEFQYNLIVAFIRFVYMFHY
ncbi:MAG: site-2 protease family protein, partial [Candidatus Flemingiibacterium sp.]